MVETLISTMEEVLPQDHEFVEPKKMVTSVADMDKWTKSEAYEEYLGFIYALNQAAKGSTNKTQCSLSDTVVGMIELLDTLDEMLEDTPPIDQPQRFGNQAFTQWLKKVEAEADNLLKGVLPVKLHAAVPEIKVYFVNGFGNGTRIDYGTGHEMSFLMLICCLFKIGALTQADKQAAVIKIFNRYMILARKLQTTYRMEPAGSHGVWSLDDYQFVPFIWGSSQLIGQTNIDPKMFLDKEVLETYSEEYLFIGCIEFINKVKTGQFAEHSNQLWNISAVPMWSTVNQGLIRMYKAEVLGKFPVIQHVFFGSILPFQPAKWRKPKHTMHYSLDHMLTGAPMPPPPPHRTVPPGPDPSKRLFANKPVAPFVVGKEGATELGADAKTPAAAVQPKPPSQAQESKTDSKGDGEKVSKSGSGLGVVPEPAAPAATPEVAGQNSGSKPSTRVPSQVGGKEEQNES